jgi:hypothetical protein
VIAAAAGAWAVWSTGLAERFLPASWGGGPAVPVEERT